MRWQRREMAAVAWGLGWLLLAASAMGMLFTPYPPLERALMSILAAACTALTAMVIIPWQEHRTGDWSVSTRAGWWFRAVFGVFVAVLLMQTLGVAVSIEFGV